MKIFKNFLHWWIAVVSVTGFLGGWAMLAHSPKPIQPGQQAAAATLEPLPPMPPLGQGENAQGQQGFIQRGPTRSFRMRTGGS